MKKIEVVVPFMGEAISEITINKYYVKVGDIVNFDDLLAEIETEKAIFEIRASEAGTITEVSVPVSQKITIGTVFCIIEAKNDEVNNFIPQACETDNNLTKSITDNNLTVDCFPKSKSELEHRLSLPKQELNFLPLTENLTEDYIPMSSTRLKIAQRLKTAQNTAAIVTTFNEVDLSKVFSYRAVLKAKNKKIGITSFFVKAVVEALKVFPILNAEIREDFIVYKKNFNIGIAVATEKGLVVPVIRNAQDLKLDQIETIIADFALKAKESKLTLLDLSGGTFSISNGGIFGSLLSTPILNPPQSGILGLHKSQERPVVVDGQIVVRPMMYLALSYDHRLIDGKEAVTFLVKIKEFLEQGNF